MTAWVAGERWQGSFVERTKGSVGDGRDGLSPGPIVNRGLPSALRSVRPSMTTAANDRQTSEGGAMNGRKRRRLLVLTAVGGALCALWAAVPGGPAPSAAPTPPRALLRAGSPTPTH